MATSLQQAVDKNLECPVCLGFFKEPKILTCSHTFCKSCLETVLESHQQLLCPTCREETSVPGGDVGRLQSNITVRSLVEDVENQGHSNYNQEDKCKKHPNQDEDCFCLNCKRYVCCKCAISEHVKNAHTILEAGDHEKNNIEELASKANAKIRKVDNYVTFVVNKRKRVHNVHEQLNDEIDDNFEESVQKLRKIRTVLKKEVRQKIGKLETALGDMEESGRKQIDEIKKVRDLVKNGLHIPLQTEDLTSHKAKCHTLAELLSQIGPDVELPRRTAEEGERIGFRSLGSDGLQMGQLRQKKSDWVLYTEVPLADQYAMNGMAISPNNEMAVGCYKGGIVIYSSEGIMQDIVLKSVQVNALHFMHDGGYVIRDSNNKIVLYTELREQVDVTFETIDVAKDGWLGGLTVDKDGLIFIAYNTCKKIQVFKPEGGKAIREIQCNGFEPWQMSAMKSSQAIVVKSFSTVHVINDVSGAIIHSISKYGYSPYPAVYQDNSVIIARVKRDQGLLSIVQYTSELKYIKNILTDFWIIKPNRDWYYLRAFKTGEIAFCTSKIFYIFNETWV